VAENGRYITIEQAQEILRVSVRQVHNHIASGRIHSYKEGKRRMLLEADVIALSEELGSANRDAVPKVEMLPDTGPLIDYIRELNSQALVMSRRIGELEAQLQQRLLPEDAAQIHEELTREQIRAQLIAEENQRLQAELEQARQRASAYESELTAIRQQEWERVQALEQTRMPQVPGEPEPPESIPWWKRLFGTS
jgi:hypothetical protein